ncbi:DUF1857-domain-containing protein [Xylaria palmicola]|nr:DUF1857-domain-containing protein [Xylaria palmicola]
MVTLNIAYSCAINRAGATPALTQSQMWDGLKKKVRQPQDFVPAITGCQILSEEALPTGESQVTRQVQFVPTAVHTGDGSVKEVCVHYSPCRVVFKQEDGSIVTALISKRPDGELLLTYVFEWRHPDVSDGTERASQLEEAHWKMAKVAVESSIDTTRRLVTEGKI